MSALTYFILQLICIALIGTVIKFAVDNYHNKRYFAFGWDVGVTFNMLIVLVGIHLVWLEVL